MDSATLFFLLTNAAVTGAYAAIALLSLFYFMRFLDARIEHGHWPMFEMIKENPLACAVYLAGRWIGACLLLWGLFG